VKPATILLGTPYDAVLCDCGAEIRELSTLELSSLCGYSIVRGRFVAHMFGRTSVAELDMSGEEPRLIVPLAVTSVLLARPFRASAICSGCSALMTYEFTPNGNVLGGTQTLPPVHVDL
jgi:hypothetical protein